LAWVYAASDRDERLCFGPLVGGSRIYLVGLYFLNHAPTTNAQLVSRAGAVAVVAFKGAFDHVALNLGDYFLERTAALNLYQRASRAADAL
jgi:hypothetical protein